MADAVRSMAPSSPEEEYALRKVTALIQDDSALLLDDLVTLLTAAEMEAAAMTPAELRSRLSRPPSTFGDRRPSVTAALKRTRGSRPNASAPPKARFAKHTAEPPSNRPPLGAGGSFHTHAIANGHHVLCRCCATSCRIELRNV